jgi:hypothetical protein
MININNESPCENFYTQAPEDSLKDPTNVIYQPGHLVYPGPQGVPDSEFYDISVS